MFRPAMIVCAAATMLVGCSSTVPNSTQTEAPSDASNSAINGGDNAVEPGANSATDNATAAAEPATRYSCENGKTVLASYLDNESDNARVSLDIAGTKRELKQAMSASGARYETAEGLTPGKKLVWWSKGDGAMLIESDPADKDGKNDIIVNCQEVANKG